ncbi:MAG TPA: ElyC/SanA/YdcF family protein [Longimicrobium sp.]|nr:ElyC/SanA/YdcF family protein [Longimicrobium sp.]
MRQPDPVKQPAAPLPPRDGAAATAPPAWPGRRRGRRLLVAVLSLALACALAWVLRAPILTAAARYLSVHDPLRKADAIFVFGGDPDIRPYAAAALYHRGLAPLVLVPGMETGRLAADGLVPTQTQLFLSVLKKEGVPDSAVRVLAIPGGTTSTSDDARVLRDWIGQTHARRVIAISTTYHTRRCRLALRRALKGMDVRVMMYGAPTRGYSERDWWKTEPGMVTYVNEYLKLARYKLRG